MLLQLVGTAMDKKFGPPYACHGVDYLEETFFISSIITLTFYIT